MTRIVLTADRTLMSEFRNLPNADFIACAPSSPNSSHLLRLVLRRFFKLLAVPVPSVNGRALRAPYGLRKLEAALLGRYKREDIAVVDPDEVERFVDDQTTIVGITTMDPLGLSPLTLVATYHGRSEAFATTFFRLLVEKLGRLRKRKGLRFKIVVGGSGALEFALQPQRLEEIALDFVIQGEVENCIHLIFRDIEEGRNLPRIIVTREYNKKIGLSPYPRVEEIPNIVGASAHSLVEVMRGCGRNCTFCEPNLRAARYFPLDKIRDEIVVNIKHGSSNAWLQSEDIFLYRLEDHRNFLPNREALIELFRMAMTIPGVAHANATHGTIAPAAADPDLIRRLSDIIRAGPDNWIGIQTGLETGSTRLFEQWMPLKGKPFSPDEWPDVIFDGTCVFNQNYWYPVYTMITGLPGETEDDVEDTIRVLERLEKDLPRKVGRERAHYFIGIFPFLNWGVLKGEKPFDLASMLTKNRLRLFQLAYKHMVRELTHPPQGVLKSPWLNTGFRLLGPAGFYMMDRLVEKTISSQLQELSLNGQTMVPATASLLNQ